MFAYVFVLYLNFDEVAEKLLEIVSENKQSCRLRNYITEQVVKVHGI